MFHLIDITKLLSERALGLVDQYLKNCEFVETNRILLCSSLAKGIIIQYFTILYIINHINKTVHSVHPYIILNNFLENVTNFFLVKTSMTFLFWSFINLHIKIYFHPKSLKANFSIYQYLNFSKIFFDSILLIIFIFVSVINHNRNLNLRFF